LALATTLLGLCAACVHLPEPPVAPYEGPPIPLAQGERRVVELYSLRLDVHGFEQVVTKADVLSLPTKVRERMWLYDLDLAGGAGKPRLIDNALARIRALPADDAKLGAAERNMIRLLNMTAANAELAGTALENLLSMGPQVGIPAQEVLAESMGVDVDAPFLSNDVVAKAMVEGVVRSHPNTRFRHGAPTDAHPDGQIPVPPGHVPVTLEDIASDLANLTTRFGPYDADGEYHPGFLVGVLEAPVLEPDFKMIIRANANALPYKGADLSHGAVGSVASIGKEGVPLFDFSDPDWLRLEGIRPEPTVTTMTFQLVEHPEFLAPGTSPLPKPMGNSTVWQAPVWSLERVIAQAGLDAFAGRDWSKSFHVGSDPAPLFEINIADGWMVMTAKGDIAAPPPPVYLWDLINQVVQVRLHDGPDLSNPTVGAIAEGQANVRFTLSDVSIGVSAEQITAAIRRNLQTDPSGLVGAAAALIPQHSGAPDLFYMRPRADAGKYAHTDWLYFIAASDLPDDSGRDHSAYSKPGFFADAGLKVKISDKRPVAGDTEHEKVPISPGDVIYAVDDQAVRYRIEVLAKPSPARIRLAITHQGVLAP